MAISQCDKIKNYMMVHGTITQREALPLGCYRLASRIHDLKESGVAITTETKKVKNKDGTFSYIAEYSLTKEGGAENA